jgi:hypothetical protein
MLQDELNKMPDAELYKVVEDHHGDEVLSAAALRLVRENRKLKGRNAVMRGAIEDVINKLTDCRDGKINFRPEDWIVTLGDAYMEDILGVDGEVM